MSHRSNFSACLSRLIQPAQKMTAAGKGTRDASTRPRQRGFIAVAVLVALLMTSLTVMTRHLWGGDQAKVTQQNLTQSALRQAKEALLAYVVQNGRLPCPADVRTLNLAVTNEGVVDSTTCLGTGVSVIGLLPWKGLGLAALKDDSETCLWYAVSGHLKSSNRSYPVNADSDGAFQVRDTTGALLVGNAANTKANAVAIIMAPHAPTASTALAQRRAVSPLSTRRVCPLPTLTSSTNTAIAQQYMDSATLATSTGSQTYDNWNVPTTVIQAGTPVTLKTFIQGYRGGESPYPLDGLNDQLAWITSDEFSKAITQYAANAAATALSRFYQPSDPVSSNFNQGYLYYPTAATASNCVANTLSGYFPSLCDANWTYYYNNGYNGDKLLGRLMHPVTGDAWATKIKYQVSAQCVSPARNCSGTGGLLTLAGQTQLHTIVMATGRANSGFVATSFTR